MKWRKYTSYQIPVYIIRYISFNFIHKFYYYCTLTLVNIGIRHPSKQKIAKSLFVTSAEKIHRGIKRNKGKFLNNFIL
jgi:hypothetical protein